MNKEQIEKEAIRYVIKETGYQVLPEHDKWKEAFMAGATAQHPKAWNEAIEAAIEKTEEVIENVDPIFQIAFHALANEFKALKLDPNQA